MKLLRTIRLDQSDAHVFARAAGPGEWAVSGAFAFAHLTPDDITGKLRQAFANGFLGLSSFGRATFVTVSEADEADLEAATDALARHFVTDYGAPDVDAALPAAREEIAFARELAAGQLVNRLYTVQRTFDEAGQIREQFRVVEPPSKPLHTRIWDVVEDDA